MASRTFSTLKFWTEKWFDPFTTFPLGRNMSKCEDIDMSTRSIMTSRRDILCLRTTTVPVGKVEKHRYRQTTWGRRRGILETLYTVWSSGGTRKETWLYSYYSREWISLIYFLSHVESPSRDLTSSSLIYSITYSLYTVSRDVLYSRVPDECNNYKGQDITQYVKKGDFRKGGEEFLEGELRRWGKIYPV